MKTAVINARVRPELKKDVESIFTQLGMTTTQAIAATNDLILVTRNTKDFQYFDGLRIENWFDD